MRKFLTILRLESKRFLPIITTTTIIFIAVCCLFLQFDIKTYITKIQESRSFTKLEEGKVHNLQNIQLYQILGYKQIGLINCLYPLFNNSTSFSDLQSLKNEGYRFEINKPEIGANSFDQPLGKSSMDYNWLYLFFGSAAFLILGFVTYHKKEDYIRFLLNFANHRVVYTAIAVSKIIIILLFLVVSFIAVLLQFHVFNGILLSGVELGNLSLFFFVLCFIIYLFSLWLGMIFGKFKSTFKGVSLAILSWFMLVIFIPEIFNVSLAKNTKSMFDSIYSHELKKLEIFSQAEKSILEEVSKYNTPAEIKNAYKSMIQQYLNGDFKKIVALEEKMLENTVKAAEKVHLCSIFTPVTFYKSAGNEISGYSYNGLIKFYKANIEQYEKFVRYCLENTMIRMRPKDNPFIKNPDDYIIKLESSLPKYFGAGILLNCFYLLILIGFSYYRFKRFIFPKPKNAAAFDNLELKYKKGMYYAYRLEGLIDFKDQFYNFFSDLAKKINPQISIDEKNITAGEKQNFAYVPHPNKIPGDIKIKSILSLVPGQEEEKQKIKEKFDPDNKKRFAELKHLGKIEFLLNIAKLKNAGIFLLDDLFAMSPVEIPLDVAAGIKDKNTLIIEFLSVASVRHDSFNSYFMVTIAKSKYRTPVISKKSKK